MPQESIRQKIILDLDIIGTFSFLFPGGFLMYAFVFNASWKEKIALIA